MKNTIYKFNDLGELKNLSRRFDIASEAAISVDEYGKAEQHKAILSSRDGENTIAGITNKHYTLVQHADMISTVADSLAKTKLPVHGHIVDRGKSVYVHAFFPDKTIEDDSKGIMLGARFTNSYDCTVGLNFSMFGMRMACSNQMNMKNLLYIEKKKHMGVIEMDKMADKFVAGVFDSVEMFQELVDSAMKDSTTWKYAEGFFVQNVVGKKHREELIQKLKDELNGAEPTRWDVYNAITSYATHDLSDRFSIQTHLENVSKKLMAKRVEDWVDEEKPMTMKKLAEVVA